MNNLNEKSDDQSVLPVAVVSPWVRERHLMRFWAGHQTSNNELQIVVLRQAFLNRDARVTISGSRCVTLSSRSLDSCDQDTATSCQHHRIVIDETRGTDFNFGAPQCRGTRH